MSGMPDRVKKRYIKNLRPNTASIQADPPAAPGTPSQAYCHHRGYMPHYEDWHKIQMITFRLADSLPRHVAERLASEPPTEEGDAAYHRRIELFLDTGYGECWLRRPEIAQIAHDDIQSYHAKRYDLHVWVIMPNHVHMLLKPIAPYTLSIIMKDLKSLTSRKINHILGRKGQLWQEDYRDRFIRNEEHYIRARNYILNNPVKAGLVTEPEAWPWLGCYKSLESPVTNSPDGRV